MSLSFFVPGIPVPQGSKNGYIRRGKVVLVEAVKALKPWRETVTAHARESNHAAALRGPVSVELRFVMYRPKGTPKRSTPPAVKKPDVDKLVRAVFDALTEAAVWGDDAQVTRLFTTKRIAEPGETPGVHVLVQTLTTEEAA